MDYNTLGRTELKVSVAGLGCGGGSKLGLGTGGTEQQSINLIRKAIELGVNFIDTASSYGTEVAVGKAISSYRRDQLVISTKFHPAWGGVVNSPDDVVLGLNNSLKSLKVEYVDIFHLHGLYARWYEYARDEILPILETEKQKGKFRFLGVTENAPLDHRHKVLERSLRDECFDVMMLAYHILNQNAEQNVLPNAQKQKIGTLIMFAVRSIFSEPNRLKTEMHRLIKQGELPTWMLKKENPLDFLFHPQGAADLIDACYRFVRSHSAVDVVLFGTGNMDHLEANIHSLSKPPLPEEDLKRLRELFGHLEGVGLDYPGGSGPRGVYEHVNEELDTSGLKCPLPVLKAKRTLRDMGVGEVLRVVSTDPSSAVDFIDYCDNSGHSLLDSIRKDNYYIYTIRKS